MSIGIILLAIVIVILLILGGVLIWLSCKKVNKDSYTKLLIPFEGDTEELVVAVCNESIDWIDDYAKYFMLVTVYNKCGRHLEFKSPNVKVINVPNIGSCDYAYLSYVIDRYDTLPDFIEFTKASIMPKKIYYGCISCEHRKREFKDLMNFKVYDHKFGNRINSEYDNLYPWHDSGYASMADWIRDQEFLNIDMFRRDICNIRYGGNFGATRDQILKTPKKVWEALRNQQKYTREEVDHFIERTWRPLLCRPQYKLVVVAIFKNEAVAMREWLDHYTKEGVEHFYMIDNGSTDNWQKETEGFSVTIYSDAEKYKQMEHYNNYFLEEVQQNAEWVLVVDLDEFMYARKGYKNIPQYLATIDPGIDQLAVPWKMFGSNGHKSQPRSIIHNFKKRLDYDKEVPDCFRYHKCLCRGHRVLNFEVHAHKVRNPKYNKVNNHFKLSEDILNDSPLHLNHYAIQSWDWFKNIKMARGDVISAENKNVRDIKYFNKYDVNDIQDNELSIKNTKIAFISGFVGIKDKIISTDRVPDLIEGDNIDCYFVTNLQSVADKATEKGWIVRKIPTPEDESWNGCNLACKEPKVFPQRFANSKKYDFVIWIDNKFDPIIEEVTPILYNWDQNKCIAMHKHPFLADENGNGGADKEFRESLYQDRYKLQEKMYSDYINTEVSKGYPINGEKHYTCCFIIYNLNHPETFKIQNMWMEHIERCGIQDQISMYFVAQRFKNEIVEFVGGGRCGG